MPIQSRIRPELDALVKAWADYAEAARREGILVRTLTASVGKDGGLDLDLAGDRIGTETLHGVEVKVTGGGIVRDSEVESIHGCSECWGDGVVQDGAVRDPVRCVTCRDRELADYGDDYAVGGGW